MTKKVTKFKNKFIIFPRRNFNPALTRPKTSLLSPVDSNVVHGKPAMKTHSYMQCLLKNFFVLILYYVYHWNLCVDIVFRVSAKFRFVFLLDQALKSSERETERKKERKKSKVLILHKLRGLCKNLFIG